MRASKLRSTFGPHSVNLNRDFGSYNVTSIVVWPRANCLLLRSSMKTLIKIAQLLFALPLLIALSACGKSSTAATTTTTGYYLSNGVCYAANSATAVATTYCSSTTGYYLSNGYCYSSTTGTIVATTYCSSTTGYTLSNGVCYSTSTGTAVATAYCSGTSTTTSQACYGMYYYSNGYATQIVQCNGTNCRGYTLYDYNTKQPVYCQ